MNCTLDICGDRVIQNPTEAEIRQAVLSLDLDKDEPFLILGASDLTYIQASGDQNAGFVLEYQDGDTSRHYQARRSDLTAEEIIKAMTSYATGTEDWKKTAEWILIKV